MSYLHIISFRKIHLQNRGSPYDNKCFILIGFEDLVVLFNLKGFGFFFFSSEKVMGTLKYQWPEGITSHCATPQNPYPWIGFVTAWFSSCLQRNVNVNICNIFLQLLHLQGHGWRVVWALYNKKEISWLGLILHLSWAIGLQLCHLLSQVRWNWSLLVFSALGNYLFIYNVYIFQNDLIWDATTWSIVHY